MLCGVVLLLTSGCALFEEAFGGGDDSDAATGQATSPADRRPTAEEPVIEPPSPGVLGVYLSSVWPNPVAEGQFVTITCTAAPPAGERIVVHVDLEDSGTRAAEGSQACIIQAEESTGALSYLVGAGDVFATNRTIEFTIYAVEPGDFEAGSPSTRTVNVVAASAGG